MAKKKSEELYDQLAKKRETVKVILDKPDEDITSEEMAGVEVLQTEIADLATKAAKAEELEAFKADNDAALTKLNNEPATKATHALVPATATKVWPQNAFVKSFKSDNGKSAAEKAGRFGYFCAAAVGKPWARRFCKENGIPLINGDDYADATKAQVETINTSGGYLVPEEFDTDIIVLREQYGVFRQNVKISPMARDTKVVPRRSGGLTAYYVGENATITASTKSWNRVQLTAKKLGVLAKYSSELDEDSIINLGDDLAGEIAYAFAKAEDQAGFIGDGTSTYGGIVGLSPAMNNVTSNAGILTQATGNTWSAITLADFNATKAKLPQYAVVAGNSKWYVSMAFWSNVMERLALAAGGVTSLEVVTGARPARFLGFDVAISQVLPVATATATLSAFLGDLNLAALMGDRRQITIAFSEHLNFAEDEIAIRGTERFDINIHDPGTSSDAGPVVALKTGT